MAVLMTLSACGNLRKKDFLPQYEAYKAENAQRFSTIESDLGGVQANIAELGRADAALREQIQDAKEEAMAAAEQGDADTLSAAKTGALDMDEAVRKELLAAVDAAKKAAMDDAARRNDVARQEARDALEQARNSAIQTLEQISAKSASDIEALRREVAKALAEAAPVNAATVTFASGKAALTDEATAALAKAVAVIKEHPGAVVHVIGHADSNPIVGGKFLTNLQLSEARAQAVADYLKAQGVGNTIRVAGRGHFSPVAVQSTAEGRQQSRRVEVVLVRE
jgi:outer membrane protein OmpA-like peptidoglycan-associated protein